MTNITPNNTPYPAYRSSEKGSFAWDSTVRRWPIILEKSMADMRDTVAKSQSQQVQAEGTAIIAGIQALMDEIAADQPLRLLKDDEEDTAVWNRHIQEYFQGLTWFSATWLFCECYLYRRVRELFSLSAHWKEFDIFENQKVETFRGSQASVFELARKMPAMIEPLPIEKQEIIYQELLHVCLWGNATDLSLLTNMTEEDIKRLQAIEAEHLAEQKKRIVVDDTDALWDKLAHLNQGRVDFVLDNSGFELFVDFVLADWMLQTNKAAKVVFNAKTIPWFVSDVMPKDVPDIFARCKDPNFFPKKPTPEDQEALVKLVERWQSYVTEGRLEVQAHDFWCYGLPYRFMRQEAPDLFDDLKKSDLVIFKGDLNFRKLVSCCDWPVTTPFKEAIGEDLAANFTSIVSLRTNKADTIVGLKEGVKEELEKTVSPNEWRCSGKYAVVEFSK